MTQFTERSPHLPLLFWFFCKHIRPSAFILYPGVWVSLDYLYFFKSNALQTTGNEISSEKHKVCIDILTEKLDQVDCPLTNVVGKNEVSTRPQYTKYFMECCLYLFFCEVNYGVESYNTSY